VSQLSRKCGILDISQLYRHPQPVKEIGLLFVYYEAFGNKCITVGAIAFALSVYFLVFI
jgi:hypothetical protein